MPKFLKHLFDDIAVGRGTKWAMMGPMACILFL
jgi:hypothetical protein